MSVFENFPYTNFHNLNLDWVLNKLKSFEKRLDNIEQNGATGGTGGGTGGGSSINKAELEAKIATKQDKLTFDTTPTQNSNNPVTSGGIYTAINSTTTTLNNSLDHVNNDLESKIADKQDKLTFDTAPTENSTNPVTSGGVYTAIDNIKGGTTIDTTELENKIASKQDKLTFDTEPTENSTNPVTSGGIYSFCNKYNLKLFGGLFTNNHQGYTLTDRSRVTITDKTINSIAHISDIYKSDVIAISVAISVGHDVARGSVVGNRLCNVFLPADGYGAIYAECYQNSSDSILKFLIISSEDGLQITFLSPDSNNMTSLHIDSVQVEILRSDNFVSSGWVMQ